ncbi:hypothetical protein [Kitasatospora sp. LaBMicrA B282]|uniref:hypothetical protein n=1 Tax=Kitasatospora sp. LaBMicrA B282 TaxID=3420949 RepID=UPI003D12296B
MDDGFRSVEFEEGPEDLDSLLELAVQVAQAGREAVLRGTRSAARGAWAYTALTSIAPPPVPVVEPWRLSIGVLLGRHPKTPALAHKALGALDRFGAVQLGPAAAGFDGEEIPWEKVVGIRTRNAFEVMTTQALEQEVDRLRVLLPPVPGRKWIVTKAAEAMATVVLAALEHGSVGQRLDELAIPVEIVHKGLLGRERVQSGGLFAAATLTVVEQSARSLIATARQHGVPVTPAEPSTAAEPDRAAHLRALRERTDAMAARLARLQQEPATDAGPYADDPSAPADACAPADAPPAPANPDPRLWWSAGAAQQPGTRG